MGSKKTITLTEEEFVKLRDKAAEQTGRDMAQAGFNVEQTMIIGACISRAVIRLHNSLFPLPDEVFIPLGDLVGLCKAAADEMTKGMMGEGDETEHVN